MTDKINPAFISPIAAYSWFAKSLQTVFDPVHVSLNEWERIKAGPHRQDSAQHTNRHLLYLQRGVGSSSVVSDKITICNSLEMDTAHYHSPHTPHLRQINSTQGETRAVTFFLSSFSLSFKIFTQKWISFSYSSL